jgi:hemoglobin
VVSKPLSAYEALNGHPGIRRAVDGFYDRIAADPILAGFFVGVDQAKLRGHQVDLLAVVAGGPGRYTGRQMSAAHAGLNITNADFDRVLGHLNAALVEAGAADGAIRDVLTAVNALRDDIVGDSALPVGAPGRHHRSASELPPSRPVNSWGRRPRQVPWMP